MNNLVHAVDLNNDNNDGNFITNPPRTLEQFLQLSNMARDLIPMMWLSAVYDRKCYLQCGTHWHVKGYDAILSVLKGLPVHVGYAKMAAFFRSGRVRASKG